ncbi:FAD-dependent oxidoreductase, partial [Escherichia coli]|nr:FAD-dependent oxidoreductase [Escherichia coli]
PGRIGELQQRLQTTGCYIPRQWLEDPAKGATVTTSSEYLLRALAPNGQWHSLSARMAILLPVRRGDTLPAMTFTLRARRPQSLTVTLLGSEKSGNFTPECSYAGVTLDVGQEGDYTCNFDWQSDRDQYVFVAFSASEEVEIALTDTHLPGLMTVFNSLNARVAKHTRQVADGDYGVDEFDFWLPRRHPQQIFPAIR